METTEVLIIGAGPTGLVLALWLVRKGVRVRIVDQAEEPGTSSRALAVVPRTLELYRQLGIADAVVERGLKLAAANMWINAKQVGRVELGDIGAGLSPFPFILIFPQDEHEQLLIDQLEGRGVFVERPTTLQSFQVRGDHVVAQLRDAYGVVRQCESSYLAGCDGARSSVRHAIDATFPGGTYSHLFYVADVEASGPLVNHEVNVALDDASFLGVFPFAEKDHVRLIGTVREDAAMRGESLGWDDVSSEALDRLRMDVTRVSWFSTYHVHHRVASHFQKGRVFILGDAAHIHSPVGGQGMNTGIGDAVNLGWKLASVLRKGASPALLDTFQAERIGFAQRLVATTDRIFQLATSDKRLTTYVRTKLVPRISSAVLARRAMRRLAFRTMSQTRIEYRTSRLSEGSAGRVHGGDRLPWVPGDAKAGVPDNYQALASLDWQLHVYGIASPELRAEAASQRIPLHVFPWRPAAARAGLEENAAYLVRPDGHVGWADVEARAAALARYVRANAIASTPALRPSPSPAPARAPRP
ncbi:MAG: FAD-dependent oxidoreductase [Myxococcaceae bacterium]|nr:FAD-dependent oxidoreductase [Myxococcaceae bacterium]